MRITWHPDAEAELTLAAEWYEERVPSLGADFVSEVIAVLDHLVFAPRSHARAPGAAGKRGARKALVDRFPYAMIYVLAEEDELVVVALIHSSRGPSAWRKRLG